MKIKLTFYVLAVFFIVDFSLADNEVKRRRPIIDSVAQDSDGNYIDQLAQDSAYNSNAENIAAAPDGYRSRYNTATDEFRKQPAKTAKSEKVHYVTPEPNQNNFSQDYVHHALKTNEKIKDNSPASSFLEYTSQTHDDPRRPANLKRKKIPSTDFEDYNYLFQESKRLTARSTSKPFHSAKGVSDKSYKPASGSVGTDKKAANSETVHNYHYYYPDEAQKIETSNYPSSTAAPSAANNPSTRGPYYVPSTTQPPKNKFSSKKKAPSVQIQQTSTDSYQYPPVLQRPSEYTPTDFSNQEFMPLYETKTFFSQSTAAPSTASPIKMLKPTTKNNFYPSSTVSPSSPRQKIRRPSTDSPYQDAKQFSVSPSPSTATHYSTTRAPEVFKYSSPASVSSTNYDNYFIKSSTPVTPSASPSPNFAYEGSNDHTVVIRPKTQYNNFESYEPKQEVNERIVYKFVPQETFNYGPNKTENVPFKSSTTFPSFPDYYKNLNTTTQADMDFYNSFQKNYNYEFFTEHDAGRMDNDRAFNSDFSDDKQKASKKNMMFPINQHESDYEPSDYQPGDYERAEYQQSDYYPSENVDHEMQPPMTDNDADASKKKYIVLYSVDDEDNNNERQRKFTKKKPKQQEPEVASHTRPHYSHGEKAEDFGQFDSEFDSEFDTDLVNSDSVRIVDPKIRGGRPLEFTKDDYLRHIKQAVVQYMREQQRDTVPATSNIKLKTERYQEFETPHRPTKIPSAAGPSYKPKQHKPTKHPKNVPARSRDPVDDMLESPHVDLTSKKHRQKPFDPSAIDVGQSYQHVTHFDHSSAVKNAEEFDPSEAVQQSKAKLHFSQQTYHDINNLGSNQKQKKHQQPSDDSESDMAGQNVNKSYQIPKKYATRVSQADSESYESVNHETYKHPRFSQPQPEQILTDEDDEDNKVEEPVDAPIQIINGFPVSNPYNIDLNTLKYMLGGIAQAEVNEQQNKDGEETQNVPRYPQDWKAYSFGSQPSADTAYPSYDQAEPTQRPKKNLGQGEPQQKPKLPQMAQNNNKGNHFKQQQQQTQNKPKPSGGKNQQHFVDFSGWTNKNKKLEPQGSSLANTYVLRPISKNKHARDESMKINSHKSAIIRHRPNLSTDMRPPPPLHQRLRVVKVL